MNDTALTVKQENFCLKYIETGNASEAYRQSYDCGKMTNEVINVKASELLKNGKITVRIEALQAEHQARHKLTVDELLAELEEARQIAKEKENAAAMTSATTGKAKLLGLDKTQEEKPIIGSLDFVEWVNSQEHCSIFPDRNQDNKASEDFSAWVRETS